MSDRDPYRKAAKAVCSLLLDTIKFHQVDDAERVLRRHFPPPGEPVGERRVLEQLHDEVCSLINDSHGVDGYHLNGEVATWEELLPGGRHEALPSMETAARILDNPAPPPEPGGDKKAEIEGALGTLERIQGLGYHLHDREGRPVAREEFTQIVAECLPDLETEIGEEGEGDRDALLRLVREVGKWRHHPRQPGYAGGVILAYDALPSSIRKEARR